jgi:dynein heavy chain
VSIPFIQELRHDAVVERHWLRIMEETGKEFEGEFNLKFITLQKVFELELQNHQEKVTEICKEAKEEARNEELIKKIEEEWKKTSFEIREYQKGGYTIKSPEEIKQQLDDNMLILGSVGASKYARSVKKKVGEWERDLNLVFDVIELWMVVQRKWIYLESIFSSEDIRIALPEEAKKFNKTDINYRKIMDGVSKNPNVLNCCVRGDSSNRIEELKMISAELDKCTQSLTNYLDSKKMALPRFYFISDDDLLEILGTSDPKAIQPHLLKLYDNCAKLIFAISGK